MTPNQIATALAQPLDNMYDLTFKRVLMAKVDIWRGLILEQSLRRSPQDRKFFVQTIFVSMERVTEIDGIPVCTPTSRSVKTIPLPLRAGSTLFDFVGSVDGYTPTGSFALGTERYLRSRYSPQGRHRLDGGGYLWFSDQRVLKLAVSGIFSSPEAAFMYSCPPDACDYWNSDYPGSPDILARIDQSILSVDYRQKPQQEDNEIPVNNER